MKNTKKQKVRDKIKNRLVRHLIIECLPGYLNQQYVIRISPDVWHSIFKTK